MPEEPKTDPRELKQLRLPNQDSIRRFLRIGGVLTLAAGALCMIIGFIDFFKASGTMEGPHLFWLFFIGMPLLFFGSIMTMNGFMGAMMRYQAGEMAPVATDTVKYAAKETQEAVETVAKAAAKGVVEGMATARAKDPKPGEGKD